LRSYRYQQVSIHDAGDEESLGRVTQTLGASYVATVLITEAKLKKE
jgi:hypothetical protein